VQVADNGTGMDLENLQQAASPHSTSKITTEADLYKIATLGFRGEALHSLAQLGCLEVLSRSNDLGLGDFSENRESAQTPAKSSFNKGGVENARSGWRVVYNNAGVAVEVETAAIAPGTVVTVDNLFGNWPVRRSFLSPTQQMRSIQLTLQQIAICHPHVNWQLRQGNTPCLHVTPGSTAEQLYLNSCAVYDRAIAVFKVRFAGDSSKSESSKFINRNSTCWSYS
jgi:DNA mismatch repair protein MutL